MKPFCTAFLVDITASNNLEKLSSDGVTPANIRGLDYLQTALHGVGSLLFKSYMSE